MNIVITGNYRSGKTILTSNLYDALESNGASCTIINLGHYSIYEDYFENKLQKEALIENMKRPEDLDRKAHDVELIEIKKESNYIYYSSVFSSDAFSYEMVFENLQRIVAALNAAGKTVLIETEGELLSSGTLASMTIADKIYYVIDESIESFKQYNMLEDMLISQEDKIKLILTHYKNKLELYTRFDVAMRLESIKLNDLSYDHRRIKKKIRTFLDSEQLIEGDSNYDNNRKVSKWPWPRSGRGRKETRKVRSPRESISETSGEDEEYNI